MNTKTMLTVAGGILVLGLILRLYLGATLEVAGGLWMWVNLGLGVVNAGLMFLLARRRFGPVAALIASGFLAFSWVAIAFELLGSISTLLITLSLGTFLAAGRMVSAPGWSPVLVSGGLLGVFSWFHPGAVVFAVFAGGWFGQQGKRAGLLGGGMALALIVICFALWGGGLAVDRSILESHLYGASVTEPGASYLERVKTYFSSGEIHPGEALFALRESSSLLKTLPFPFAFTLALALVGMVLLIREGKDMTPGQPEWEGAVLASLLVGYVAAMAIASVTLGHGAEGRLPILPVLYLLGAVAVAKIDQLNQTRGLRGAGPWIAAAAVLWLGLSLNRVETVPAASRVVDAAVAEAQAGRFDQALALLDQALAENPDHAMARFRRVEVLLQLQRPEDAIQELGQLIARSPDWVEPYVERGRLLAQGGRLGEAVTDFQTVVELQPDRFEGWIMLAAALQGMNRLQEAEMYFLRALSLRPDSADAMIGLGFVYLTRDRPDEARPQFEEALRIRPDDPEALRGMRIIRGARPSTR